MMKSSANSPFDGLVDLACRDGVDIGPTLRRVLTDLFVQKPKHSPEEEIQYVELALGLIAAVDAPTRAAVMASLSTYPTAPAAILSKLRGAASPPSTTVSAQSDARTHDFNEMFFAAAAEERRLILVSLDTATEAPARRPASASSEVIRRLETAALQHNAGEFSRMLERALGIGHTLAERITRDQSGEPIVIAAKALGMKAAVLQRVLLFLNPGIGQSVERVHDLARLFDDLKPRAAESMVAIWRKAGGQPRPVHEPVRKDDEARSARSPSTPAPHRSVPERHQQASRFKTGAR
jgi:hypothetical protein